MAQKPGAGKLDRSLMANALAMEDDRVRRNTDEAINAKIDADTGENIRYYTTRPRSEIDQRIAELNTEWDIERLLATNAATLALTGVALGAAVSRKWLLLSGTVLGFLLLHGVQGWCPPLPVLRRLGVRTRTEIDRERLALQYLRGDFQETLPTPRPHRRLGALVAQS